MPLATWIVAALLLTVTAEARGGQSSAPDGLPPTPETTVAGPEQPFDQWLAALITEARGRGFSQQVIDATLVGLQPLERVVTRDTSQAELTLTFDLYIRTRVTPSLVRLGRRRAAAQRPILTRIQREYGVPANIVLGIWGLESHFGSFTGATPVFQALATLAWQPRRSAFFRGELYNALTMVSGGFIDAKTMTGSWAGAMGQPQFMPSSYLAHAVDFDHDGRRDIWRSTPDALASIANYLRGSGWTAGQTWGREVSAPPDIRARLQEIPRRADGCSAKRAMSERRPLSEWRAMGLQTAARQPLPSSDMPAALVDMGDRLFLVYPNYDALLDYNCAHLYALSVALLGDRLR